MGKYIARDREGNILATGETLHDVVCRTMDARSLTFEHDERDVTRAEIFAAIEQTIERTSAERSNFVRELARALRH